MKQQKNVKERKEKQKQVEKIRNEKSSFESRVELDDNYFEQKCETKVGIGRKIRNRQSKQQQIVV